MKGFALAVVGVVATAALYAINTTSDSALFLKSYNAFDADENEFMRFITKYRRTYGTKEEYQYRLNIFKENLELIN